MKVLLYQPDIAGNVGTIIRMCACLGLDLDIIEPCGFPFNKEKIKKSGLDYVDKVNITRYSSFQEYKQANKNYRIILLTTKASVNYLKFKFEKNDILMVGRESAGVPDEIHNSVDGRVVIEMQENTRCLNVAMSLAMVVGETLRQINL
ncbi:MAG: tRNA (cytidine(34)-2'-O)-methyltransferase [Rickettsiales bacterium]|nr:tRNA (cytidine(34)-2'-O)-methyltransferase [Rickettsiales bacterium]